VGRQDGDGLAEQRVTCGAMGGVRGGRHGGWARRRARRKQKQLRAFAGGAEWARFRSTIAPISASVTYSERKTRRHWSSRQAVAHFHITTAMRYLLGSGAGGSDALSVE
jgi:hypothetical protein